jgi:hypothetical protein
MMILEEGRIPLSAISPLLSSFLEEHGETVGSLAALADRSGVSIAALEKYMCGERRSMLFDHADGIVCALGKVDLWRSELSEYYENVNLNLRQCAHPDCSVWFTPGETKEAGARNPGSGRRQKYCSTPCANSARVGNRRIKHFRGAAQRGEHSFRCRNGHVRTPETTITLKSGKIRCRICNNESSNRSYKKARAA